MSRKLSKKAAQEPLAHPRPDTASPISKDYNQRGSFIFERLKFENPEELLLQVRGDLAKRARRRSIK